MPWGSQEVYGKLEEPDGLAGLARLRSGGALLQDQVLAAEKAGSWGEALGLHEQVSYQRSWATPLDPSLGTARGLGFESRIT